MIDVLIGIFELAISLSLGFLTVWFAFKMLAKLTPQIDDFEAIRGNNAAVGILFGATILSAGLVVKQAAYPMVSSLQTGLHKGLSWLDALKLIGIVLFSVALVMAISLIAVWTAVRLFLRLTRDIDEMAEIRRNNVAVAIILGCMIVVIGLFLGQGIQSLLASIVPVPAFGNIKVM
jgi:uncharacterized membrane protein YjfL (UPF0719 family)